MSLIEKLRKIDGRVEVKKSMLNLDQILITEQLNFKEEETTIEALTNGQPIVIKERVLYL